MTTYSALLRHPKWQKKRLEILDRDNFVCQICGDTETTIHVHHRYYKNGKKPWEYDNRALVALCENCHEHETENLKKNQNMLIEELSHWGYFADDFGDLLISINNNKIPAAPPALNSAIDFILRRKFIHRRIKREMVLSKKEKAVKHDH